MLAFILAIPDEQTRTYLECLYNKHHLRMYHSAFRILDNKQDAEDALQETFIKIQKNIEDFERLSGDDLILMIIVYTKNTARDILRRRNVQLKHMSEELLCESSADDNVEEIVINRERIQIASRCIDSLPSSQKEVIIMRYRLGMSEKKISEISGISESAVSSRIFRAKESIRKMMGEYCYE